MCVLLKMELFITQMYGLVLTAVIEVRNRKFYILVDIILFLLRRFYDILCVMFAYKSWKYLYQEKFHILYFHLNFYIVKYHTLNILEILLILEVFCILSNIQ